MLVLLLLFLLPCFVSSLFFSQVKLRNIYTIIGKPFSQLFDQSFIETYCFLKTCSNIFIKEEAYAALPDVFLIVLAG